MSPQGWIMWAGRGTGVGPVSDAATPPGSPVPGRPSMTQQDPLQLLGGPPAPQPRAAVLLGTFDEHLAEALVQAAAVREDCCRRAGPIGHGAGTGGYSS